MNRNGQPSRLVPSLDGSLYQMDGEGIEPLPLAADLLLTSTYKLTDEASIVGGKEIETYGIDVNTGKVRCRVLVAFYRFCILVSIIIIIINAY